MCYPDLLFAEWPKKLLVVLRIQNSRKFYNSSRQPFKVFCHVGDII